MPQCVLTLSLIALSFDVYDGHQNLIRKQQKRGKLVNEDTALDRIPSLLETMSKAFFPPTFLIGPLVGFKEYLQFIESDQNVLHCW